MSFLYPATAALGAFLLFLLEPLYAKVLLPWFGGSSAVWTLCLVFFQVVLLLGYAYADLLVRKLSPRTGAWLHVVLLLTCLAALPIHPDPSWRPVPGEDPVLRLLFLLAVKIGPPFLLLSATSPLVQAWYVRLFPRKDPYPLFSWSNAASLAALLSFPFLVEPHLSSGSQMTLWSLLFVLFTLLCGSAAFRTWTLGGKAPRTPKGSSKAPQEGKAWAWVALSALGSMLLLSVTGHMTQNVTPMPLLWVLPLSLYLLTFVLAFGRGGIYRRDRVVLLLAAALVGLNLSFYDPGFLPGIRSRLALTGAGLFLACYFCHGELAGLRPGPKGLTRYYLSIALGGALGALFVGLLAPRFFLGLEEFPITLLGVSLAALILVRRGPRPVRAVWVAIPLYLVLTFGLNERALHRGSLEMSRDFYGALRVVKDRTPGGVEYRTLCHGVVSHGKQFQDPERRRQGTSYYSPHSGGALALRYGKGPKKVGVIGLGAGTLAAYGRAGGQFRIYEIDPQVVRLAGEYFTFLEDCASSVEVVLGDARLSLEKEDPNGFDVLEVDAFSGDAVPVHLLTQEAFALFLRHLGPDGILAFHTSNRYLDLERVVRSQARRAGWAALTVRNRKDEEALVDPTEWVLVTRNEGFQRALISLVPDALEGPALEGSEPWTDDFNHLAGVFR